MLRFPNPGSNIDHFVRIFQAIFPTLRTHRSFNLDDISAALVAQNLATSSGHMGAEALRRSTRDDRSRDPLYNQSKMYSELYRVLGWLHPTPGSQLIFTFTYLGAHVAEAIQDPRAIVLESILGIAYPNPIVNVKGDNNLRPFVTFLKTMRDMDGILSRDELIVGPMSLQNDRDNENYNAMIQNLRGIRGSSSRLAGAITTLSKARKISQVTMGNYTRFPLAVLRWSGWARSAPMRGVYEKSQHFLQLTDEGEKLLRWAESATDIRGADLIELSGEAASATARLGFYGMLERAGFDTSPHKHLLDDARSAINEASLPNIDLTRPVLFSPFQELSPAQSQALFPTVQGDAARDPASADLDARDATLQRVIIGEVKLGSQQTRVYEREEVVERLFHDAMAQTGQSIDSAVDHIFSAFRRANQADFYPLVAALFRSLGYNCQHSRAGVNYQRYDAIIIDDRASIPIEIKSPGEELFLSVKAVRQALENKIVLLSRRSFPTTKEATSLVVGYNPPNNRSEVSALIEDVHTAFGITVGVIDFRSLLQIVGATVLQGRSHDKGQLETLYGLINVSDA